ncbi:dCMP deaminase family protein [bacterium AH-315-C07]|nr:dCMP deaminase family protein [bacterium AH-315-C07]
MKRPDFNEIYMELAEILARKSHCVKANVGAVLVKDTRIVSVGYNGPPSKTHNCDEEWPDEGCPRDNNGGCSLALHAEENAIIFAAKNGTGVEGSTLYMTLSPCLPCSRLIYTAGIKKLYYLYSYADFKGFDKDEGLEFLKTFGVKVHRFQYPEEN